jgi:positive regulator of sigma E activity
MRRSVAIGLIVLFLVYTITTAMFIQDILMIAMIAFGAGLTVGLARLYWKKKS